LVNVETVLSNHNSRTVVVLGASRSGTSVTAGVLSALGVDMGRVREGTADNPMGAFEDRDFEAIHRDLFRAVGADKNYWDPPTREEIAAAASGVTAEIERFIRDKSSGKTLWGWKHPRSILTIDLFLPYLSRPHFIIVFRNPIGIARSSVEITSRYEDKVDFLRALKLTNYYYTEMVDFLRRNPELPRIFIAFEDLVRHPLRETRRLAEFLGIDWTEEKQRRVERLIIPRGTIGAEKRKAGGFFTGKLPRLMKRLAGRRDGAGS
jgi:hypothetical protein